MPKCCLYVMLFFIGMALIWAIHDPVCANLEIRALHSVDSDPLYLEQKLYDRGRGSLLALREGLTSENPNVRLRCARILALLDDQQGNRQLLKALGADGSPEIARLAEQYLLQIWDLTRAPPPKARTSSLRATFREPTKAEEKKLEAELASFPAWAGGYVLRARWHLKSNELYLARRDAIMALLLEPEHFEATMLLARCYLFLDYHEHAVLCFERAIKVNPGLRHLAEEELKIARREAAAEQHRRRLNERKERPMG